MLTSALQWKQELLRSAARLEKKTTQKRWTDQTAFIVERDVMVGAYAIRKLLETPGRVSDHARTLHVPVLSHSLDTTTRVTWWTALHWWELYDMETYSTQRIPLRHFCNSLIHSFVFAFHPTPDNDGLAGMFVNSEYESKKALFFIATETFVELFRAIGNDDVHALGYTLPPK
jgi:hypothetical protein